jgi:hypothetical protein
MSFKKIKWHNKGAVIPLRIIKANDIGVENDGTLQSLEKRKLTILA